MGNVKTRALLFAALFIVLSLGMRYYAQGQIYTHNIISSLIGGLAGGFTIFLYNKFITKK